VARDLSVKRGCYEKEVQKMIMQCVPSEDPAGACIGWPIFMALHEH
jgi:hypothetical protein